ncbi:hypothetical protein [Sediminivirga luteola]|uniref:Uncharacterized protein n=1 Tax=Sediminivirga luteola TaxID=1774748 RepID=A0A8J2TX39_9MICO|nr:hypothetical protein [Sediminivirga luteola]GGA11013.1 hypothetical protein GCM10011333_12310 [Sediminivirga luteola]
MSRSQKILAVLTVVTGWCGALLIWRESWSSPGFTFTVWAAGVVLILTATTLGALVLDELFTDFDSDLEGDGDGVHADR